MYALYIYIYIYIYIIYFTFIYTYIYIYIDICVNKYTYISQNISNKSITLEKSSTRKVLRWFF